MILSFNGNDSPMTTSTLFSFRYFYYYGTSTPVAVGGA
jgi:hypothetical protein